MLKPELSEHHISAEYGQTPSDLRTTLANKLGVSPNRIRLFVKRPDGSEYDITHTSESVGSLVQKYGSIWYATIEEPYGSSLLLEAISTFREHYLSSEYLKKHFHPLAEDPGLGIHARLLCKKPQYCANNRPYDVFILPSVGYPNTEPLIFVSPKVWHKCCFYTLNEEYFRTKALEFPELAPSLEKVAEMVSMSVNACVMHLESWDYIRQSENPLEVVALALCTDVGLCHSTGA
ncbi:hypothetical protein IPA_09200 [Ignicoccus pacificus DSM 13166]|uniref:Uncharacterized protein n=1 Tax=Ignicoccus pacificus DSM 13166 TaxID=940294 RepID=A0A977KC06_9CREN|nr:hypothetical protein IPA_09200 [Ignicoccus pacificus DSM 13166]